MTDELDRELERLLEDAKRGAPSRRGQRRRRRKMQKTWGVHPRRRTALRVLRVAVVVLVIGGGSYYVMRGTTVSMAPAAGDPYVPYAAQSAPPPYTGPTRSQPFRGTPAASLRDGLEGFSVPAARATGPYSVAQVAAAYSAAWRLLVTANLDPRVVVRRDPTPVLQLLSPAQQ